jgi:hypothetical protein
LSIVDKPPDYAEARTSVDVQISRAHLVVGQMARLASNKTAYWEKVAVTQKQVLPRARLESGFENHKMKR